MTIDVPIAQRVTGDFERALARKWLCRLSYSVLAAGGLVFEASGVFVGGTIAEAISPTLLSGRECLFLALTYLILTLITGFIQFFIASQKIFARSLLWLSLIFGFTASHIEQQKPVEAVLVWLIIVTFCTILSMLMQKWVKNNIFARIQWQTNSIAFLGNSVSAAAMLGQLQQNNHKTARILGFFDDRLDRRGPLTGLIPCLGTIDDLVGYIHDAELSEVYMALPWSAGPRISQLLERLKFLPLTVRLIPDHVPPALPIAGDGQLQGIVMPTLMLPPFSTAAAILKRSIDIFLSATLLIPLLPLFIIVSICLKLESPGPVFFRQIRSGQFGKPFRIYKFRSLRIDQADTTAETLVVAGDRRVTRIGQIIRKYSIDELPQVFNVLLGQMSLVGPRPHAPRAKADGRIYAEVIPEYMLRYRVKPGMTGWAQVNGWRGNTDTEEQLRKRIEFDFEYIRDWSPWKDLRIMFRTIPAMLLPPAQNV